MGFYNFCLSLVMFFVVLGYWLGHRGAFTLRSTLILLSLTMLLYFCHLVAVLAAGLVAGGMTLGQFTRRPCPTLPRSEVLPLAAAFLPAVALGAVFVLNGHVGAESSSTEVATTNGGPAPLTLGGKLHGLCELEPLISYQITEGLVTLPLGLGILLFASALI